MGHHGGLIYSYLQQARPMVIWVSLIMIVIVKQDEGVIIHLLEAVRVIEESSPLFPMLIKQGEVTILAQSPENSPSFMIDLVEGV